jgi:hypothetical protein
MSVLATSIEPHRLSMSIFRSELSETCDGLQSACAAPNGPGLPHRKLRNWPVSGKSVMTPLSPEFSHRPLFLLRTSYAAVPM